MTSGQRRPKHYAARHVCTAEESGESMELRRQALWWEHCPHTWSNAASLVVSGNPSTWEGMVGDSKSGEGFNADGR